MSKKIRHRAYWDIFFLQKQIFENISSIISTIAITYLFLYFTGSPFISTDFFNESKYALLFISNIFYMYNSGYFDVSSDSRWLLHTWSLSVEWQFYILFPILTFLYFKIFGKRSLIALYIVLFTISLYFCLYFYSEDKNTSFYGIASRSWELLFGALISLLPQQKKLNPRVIEISGLILIFYSLFFLANPQNWPDIRTALPVLGAGLIIYSQVDNSKSLLKNFIFQYIGTISYSLYLWHWIVFSYLVNNEIEFSPQTITLSILASFALAHLSHRFLERFNGDNTKILVIAPIVFYSLAAPANYFMNKKIEKLYSYKNYGGSPQSEKQFGAKPHLCFLTSVNKSFDDFDKDGCLKYEPNKKNILLIGDSHAAQYSLAIKNLYPGYNIIQATASGCHPWPNSLGASRCTDMMNYIYDTYIEDKKFDKVIVSAYWLTAGPHDAKVGISLITQKFKPITDNLSIIGQTPVFKSPFYQVAIKSDPTEYKLHIDKKTTDFNDLLANYSKEEGIPYINVYELFNENEMISKSGIPFMFDKDHFTQYGADKIIPHI
ncbi:acyltransferase family protein [Hafnia alvei]|nr:acyltransferase family protein [Hafnia alvei]